MTNLSIYSSNLTSFGVPAPVIPNFPPRFEFPPKPRTEAIHVSDLPILNALKKQPTVSNTSQFAAFTTILSLLNYASSLIGGNELPKQVADLNSSSIPIWSSLANVDDDNITNKTSFKQARHNRYNCRYGYQGRFCDPCGVTFNSPVVKIVGGFDAAPHSWPATAMIIFNYKADVYLQDQRAYYNLDEQMVCGGSLISRDTILSAAHCIVKKLDFSFNGKDYTVSVRTNNYFPTQESMYSVYLGLHDASAVFSGGNLEHSAVKVKVQNIIPYPFFNEDNLQNDIALIKLEHEVQLNRFVQLACLPEHNYPRQINVGAFAMGWGTTQQGGAVSTRLRNVRLTIYDHRRCDDVLPQAVKNWHSQLCAGELAGGRDTCQGDSGGSLFVRDSVDGQTKFIAVGVVSYGDGCAKPLTPGLYTKISSYLEWIDFFY